MLSAFLSSSVLAAEAGKTAVDLAKYFLKTPTSDVDTKLIDPFLKIDAETLPVKLRRKVVVKQYEIAALIRLHDTKKAGSLIQPADNCDEHNFVKPLSLASAFEGMETVTEDELKYVMDKTKCTEIDLGCRFSMLIFFEKKKDRILKFSASDPIMAIVAEARGKSGSGTHFFGITMTCMH